MQDLYITEFGKKWMPEERDKRVEFVADLAEMCLSLIEETTGDDTTMFKLKMGELIQKRANERGE